MSAVEVPGDSAPDDRRRDERRLNSRLADLPAPEVRRAVLTWMLTAIVVGMVGVFAMHSRGLVQLHLKPTRYAANVAGGLIFGIGFALLGYCPGTGAAALGQGNLDAVAGSAGLLAGSYLYAMCSRKLSATILAIGNRGGIMLPDLFNMRSGLFLAGFVPLLLLSLVLLEAYTG